MDKRLIRNAIQTPDGTVIESSHRHAYVTHLDANGKTYMVDGGLDYLRRNLHDDYIDVSLYDDAPHSIQIEHLTWGSYGKNGDQPLRHIKIKDMETEHIQAVLNECHPSYVLKKCMLEELKSRGESCYDEGCPHFGTKHAHPEEID